MVRPFNADSVASITMADADAIKRELHEIMALFLPMPIRILFVKSIDLVSFFFISVKLSTLLVYKVYIDALPIQFTPVFTRDVQQYMLTLI
jgi:hypothetical protein